MTKAGDLWFQIADKLMKPINSEATAAGTTTTLKDNKIPDVPADDYYNDGTIFFRSGTNLDKVAQITDFDQDDGSGVSIFTFTPAVSATADGDLYCVTEKIYSLETIKAALNAAIRELPWIDATDESLTTVANQESYTLPAGVTDVQRVYVAQSTSSPYEWAANPFYRIRHDGTNYKLFWLYGHEPETAGYTIRIIYRSYPSVVADWDDTLNDWYDPEWVTWAAVVYAMRWRHRGQRGQDPYTVQGYQEAMTMARLLRRKHFERLPQTPRQMLPGVWSSI